MRGVPSRPYLPTGAAPSAGGFRRTRAAAGRHDSGDEAHGLVDGNNSMGSHRDGWLRNRTEAAPSMATASDRVSSGLTGWPVSAGWARYRGGIDIALLAIYGPESWVRIAHQSQRVRATGRARLTQAKSGICALFDSPPWVTAGAWKHPASCTSAKHQRPSLTTIVPGSR